MEHTPLMKQYLAIKKSHPEAILLFRVGDFYEMFFEDAVTASKILNIALTSRDKSKENGVPLCGIPHHALNNYLVKFIKAGLRVALCEQMEDPRMVKGIVKREVVRVISPGTLIESELLESQSNNYFAAFLAGHEKAGLAFIDISTGDFSCAEFEGKTALSDLCKELETLRPREILIPDKPLSDPALIPIESNPFWKFHRISPDRFAYEPSASALLDHFNVPDLSVFGCEDRPMAVSAAGTLFSYLLQMVKAPLSHVTRLNLIRFEGYMIMDHSTHLSLELDRNSYDGKTERSLLWVMDKTETAMGSRLLKKWMLRPLIHKEEIQQRQACVDFFYHRFELSRRLISELKRIHDIERIVSRISLNGCNGRDLVALKKSLHPLKAIEKQLQLSLPPLLEEFLKKWDNLEDLIHLIEGSITEDSPLSPEAGSLIKMGYSPELDELKSLGRNMKTFLAGLEKTEKEKTGIEQLKIRYNQVAGYYIEVPKGKSDRVPGHYHRKQTLAHAERYTIAELTEYEYKIRESEKTIRELEQALFEKIRKSISGESSRILLMAGTLAAIDILIAFAETARENHYVRPVIEEASRGLKIVEGRHPVIEKILPPGQFVPNDAFFDPENAMMVITGPNMAGKSTYMRQVALIVIMAQMGNFVPAKECTLGIVDRLFTRIGAADYLSQGQSTFMVEMMETAGILNSATSESLILLDEIGRGTSTYDGISIAWAVAEYILKRTGSRTLFATHYLELTGLPLTWANAKNYNISVKEWNDEIIFLRKIAPGAADRSYGIQVARLAGIPSEVIKRSKELLANLEGEALDASGLPRISHSSEAPPPEANQVDLFLSRAESNRNQAVEMIKKIDLLNLTPLEAINFIHRIKAMLEQQNG